MPEMSLSHARKWVHMEERALDSQTGVQETIGKRKRAQQAPQVTRFYQASDYILVCK